MAITYAYYGPSTLLMRLHSILTQCCEVNLICMLQMKKLRLRMVKQLAQDHRKLLTSPLHSLSTIFGQILQLTHSLLTQAQES